MAPLAYFAMVGAVLLGLFATACSTSTTVDTAIPSGAAATDPTPTPQPEVDEPTAAPAPEPDPTAEPSAAPTVAPAPAPTDVAEATNDSTDNGDNDGEMSANELSDLIFGRLNADAEFDSAQIACAVDKLSDTPGLIERADAASDFALLSAEDQTALALIGFDCAPEVVAEQFSRTFDSGDVPVPPEVGSCLMTVMSSSPDRAEVISGFLALNAQAPLAEEAKDPVVDAMVECFPGSAFGPALSELALEDPTLAAALDIDCVTDGLDGPTMRPMWRGLVDNPGADFENLPPEAVAPLLDAMFSCVSFGQIVAAEAAADGVTLSPETIGCIDAALSEIDIVVMMQTGEGADQVTGAMLNCLSPDEFAAIGG